MGEIETIAFVDLEERLGKPKADLVKANAITKWTGMFSTY
jgi:hypothetical protein